MIRLLLRLVRLAFFLLLGSAVAAKLLLVSRAEPESQEIDLVNIFGGEKLLSSADPFYGGKITNAFGGTVLDLRKATPAPTGIYLDVLNIFGGLDLVIPHGWRLDFDGSLVAGGFSDETESTDDPDAPLVRVGGLILFGGMRASTRSQVEVVGG